MHRHRRMELPEPGKPLGSRQRLGPSLGDTCQAVKLQRSRMTPPAHGRPCVPTHLVLPLPSVFKTVTSPSQGGSPRA